MALHARTRRFAAWLATFAILLAALAPTVSHAMAAVRGGASWVEICTATGPALVKVAAEQVPAKGGGTSHFDHCPFCSIHAGAAGLPPAAAALPVATGAYALPELFLRAPRPLFAWAAGQPRAPPAA
ncbi:MAG TPA: DUF2946 domain-containing protein [Burkholderiales bacterium]|nr:DUF2946 domain-containing protein [Burkholderiales bacterium]